MDLASLTQEQVEQLKVLNVTDEAHLTALLQDKHTRWKILGELGLSDEEIVALLQELEAKGHSTDLVELPPLPEMGVLEPEDRASEDHTLKEPQEGSPEEEE